MRRVDSHVVAQAPQDALLNRVAEGAGGLPYLLGIPEQVGPAQIAHQQRAAGEQEGRVLAGFGANGEAGVPLG